MNTTAASSMDFRDALTAKPGRGLAIAGGLLLIGLAAIMLQLHWSAAPNTSLSSQRAFFSNDDGKSWFADDASKLPPFDKDGRPAVLAHVYRGSDGKEFVNHLERYTPEARDALLRANAPNPTGKTKPDQAAIQGAMVGGREMKRPGDNTWVNAASFKDASKVIAVRAPNGATDAQPIRP